MRDFKFYLDLNSEIGFVEQTSNAIIYVNGLPNVKPEEVVMFETGEFGMALSFTRDIVEILVFSDTNIRHGTRVTRTNEFLKIPVGRENLGNITDALGSSILPIKRRRKSNSYRNTNTMASGILSRITINKQLETGVPIVDLIMPLGFGQRQLIIGDRKTGKTNFLMQAILTQALAGNICVYAAIGKKRLDIKEAEDFFRKHNIFDRVAIVASGFDDPTGLTHLVPYSAMALSEYFRDEGENVLLILDDLTTHAKFYREISLLGKRFPGRNSYPGDIFYTHAQLLEKAGNFKTDKGERSITCLPVVETTQGDLSGYIQTNIMSMTDGHLYFDSDLFAKGRRPAINPFLSVTRVGKQTQSNLKRSINREILSFLTLFDKMQNFAHFGAEANESTKTTLSMGEKIIKFLDQSTSSTMPINLQIILFSLLWKDILQNKNLEPTSNDSDMNKMIEVYKNSKNVKKEIDDMIANADSLNDLLKVLKDTGEKLFLRLKE